jgi:hypothetical protein
MEGAEAYEAQRAVHARGVIGRQAEDPGFREERDRSAFAREAAIRLVRYRVERGLTLAQLAPSVVCSSR